jgi:hypothetical protein
LGGLERDRAAATQDRQRRKATICCTVSSSGKAVATSSTRSFNVPVGANNCL